MNLRIEELLPECEACGGTGKLENPAMKQRNQGGYGSHLVWASPVDCHYCRGKGVVPTELGETLLEFMRRAKNKGLLR